MLQKGRCVCYNTAVTTCGFSSVVRALPCHGRGQELESPNPHQIRTKFHRRARKRLFCLGNYGFAEQNPSVFLGEELQFRRA